MLGIQEMTILVIYVRKVSGLFLRTYKFLKVCKIQEEAIASSCLLLATPMQTDTQNMENWKSYQHK